MKFLHCADAHLDSPLRGLERYDGAPAAQIRGATRQAFERVIDLAISEQVDFVLIAGDIYDGDWKDYNTGLYFAARMSKLREADIRVFIIHGNHDAASQITKSLRLPDNVRVLSDREPESIRLDDLGVVIHGQGFSKRTLAENISEHYPPASQDFYNIGMLHTSATGRPGHETYAPCNVEDLLEKGYDYWALGHVHAREVLHQEPWIVFPGNLQGRHIRETGPKGPSLVTVEEGHVPSVEHHDTDVLRWCLCEVDASGISDVDGVIDCIRTAIAAEVSRSEGRLLAVRVQVSGACAAHTALVADPHKWTAEVRSAATDLGDVWIEKVKFQTSLKVDLKAMLQRDDPLGRLVSAIHELDKKPELLDELASELDDLQRKLPAELRPGDSLLGDAVARHEVLEEVRQILLPRLLSIQTTR